MKNFVNIQLDSGFTKCNLSTEDGITDKHITRTK